MTFPSIKARHLRRVLEANPLCYRVVRRTGSHLRMESTEGYPPLTFAFHDRQELPGGLVRRILTKTVGLAEDEARQLLG